MKFEVGKKYTGKNPDDEPILIQITRKLGDNEYAYKILEGNIDGLGLVFFDSSDLAKILKPYEDLPRICRVLGGEDTPLKEEEIFTIEEHHGKFRISCVYGLEWTDDDEIWHATDSGYLVDIINHPEKIIRSPQFSDDGKALMRLYVKAGYPTFVRGEMRGEDNQLMAYCSTGSQGFYLPEKVLPQITIQNSPFDAEKYLESEGKSNG